MTLAFDNVVGKTKIIASVVILSFVFMFAFVGNVAANEERYIESGSTLTDTVYNEGSKWYTFTTTQDNGDMYIYLSNETAPVSFTIYDSNKNRISSRNNEYFDSLKAGTYYIEVKPSYWGSSYSSGSFDLTATYADGNYRHNSSTLEPNDTRENAYKLTSGKKITSSISNPNDRDFFEITNTKDNGDVYIYLSNTSAPVKFRLYDHNKKPLDYYSTSYFKSLKAGKYYIEVYPDYWGSQYSQGNYDLIATFSTPNVKHDPNTLEPNDIREYAYPLTSGKSIFSKLENGLDQDYYSIQVNKEGYVNIELSGTSAPTRFTVYNGDKTLLSSNNISYSRKLKAGTYYVEVKPRHWGDSYSNGTYTLSAGFPNSNIVKSEILLTVNSKIAKVNGKNKTLLAAPYVKSGTTLVPIRLISEELGASVQWKASNQSIKIVMDGTVVDMRVGSRFVTVNGSTRTLPMVPEVKNGTTFVPVRFISEEYGRSVTWNAKSQQILIK